MVCTTSSTDLKPIQPLKPTTARTSAYHLTDLGTANGSAATSTTPPNSIASRVMFDPICELISHTSTMPSPYTADVMRTVSHSAGTRTHTRIEYSSGRITEPMPIGGCVPENGNSHADTATTAVGARPSAHAPGRRFCRNSAAAARPTNRPATGEAMVASAASGAAHRAFAQRL
ncbi:hypothetical protein TPAU25S_00952 [Tsukamurella paurometabola]